MRRFDHGFTLVEMVITVAIVAILATIVVPITELAIQRNKEQDLRTALRQIREAIDAYKEAVEAGHINKVADQSGYPGSLDLLEDGVEDVKSPKKAKLYFLRRIPRDPFFADTQTTAAETWGKRSYESPADEPREGKDVYDVYSLSNKTGLNKTPYREW